MMWGAAIVAMVVLVLLGDSYGFVAWTSIAAGPLSVAVTCLIAKMFDNDGVTRVLAFSYALTVTLVVTAYAAWLA